MKKLLMIASLVLTAQIATAGQANKGRSLSSNDPALSHSKKIDCPFRSSGAAFDRSNIKPHGSVAKTNSATSTSYGSEQ